MNEIGNGDPSDCGEMRVHVGGRSWVIHMLLNGFLLVGAEPHEEPRAPWLVQVELACSCTWPACAMASVVASVALCDHATGSGSVAAEYLGRNGEPAMRAMKRLDAAAIAMAARHRRLLPAPRRPTVA
ncbi:hypothetical protein K3U93_08250 [Mycobacterium malmoense]|uniref:hypothetical protein n=1 Tax=Mycobacterium malmoense TaxID=1780 RepID=UPI0015933B96|nr:hypothetical protein [Mycobacterium malmoense]QZA19107.1 hypothetical protein K3U93_08250 [Mycobacterium malmoense]UNB95868.1 hypothetical protein H5T25_08240 [Mycobacterium malmoense]